MITLQNILYCYNTVKTNDGGIYDIGRRIGYLEACLLQFDALEVVSENGKTVINRLVIRPKSFLISEKRETVYQAILRMTENLLTQHNLL